MKCNTDLADSELLEGLIEIMCNASRVWFTEYHPFITYGLNADDKELSRGKTPRDCVINAIKKYKEKEDN
jgi:hypothetical protein